MQLAAALASLAGDHAGAGFGAGALARIAEFLPRQANLGADAGGGLFKAQFHVVPQVGAALHARAATAAGASKDVFESEEIAEDVLKFLVDRGVDPRVPGRG
jgi:hypothetical protein